MKMSVLVCMYNSSKEDVIFTLDSIINQNFNDYEIIITDDGSANNHEIFLERYFKQHGVSSYKLRMGEKNEGTVCNLLHGLQLAEGEYIKPIGAGDALASPNVLRDVTDYMENTGAKMVFTGIKLFKKTDGKRIYGINGHIPIRTMAWKNRLNKRILKNVIVLNDQISGASIFYNTNYFELVLRMINPHVKYMEDLCQYIALLEGINIRYSPQLCILYECHNGISTNKSESNNRKMLEDKNNFLDFMFVRYAENPYVKKRFRLEQIERKYKNKVKKFILKSLCEPEWIIVKIQKSINAWRQNVCKL